MPSAIAALPLPIKSQDFPSLADGSAAAANDSIVAADFAALLLGQLAGGIDTSQLTTATEQIVNVAADVTAETLTTPTDPALLLASMGIAVPAAMADRLAESGQRPVDSALLTPQDMDQALPVTAELSQKPGASGDQSAADLFSRINNSGAAQAASTQPLAETPAKLAGFEQKLAESTQALAEPVSTTAQPGNATQLGVNAATARHAGSEHLQIDTPLKSQAWPTELGQKIVWLTGQDKQSAQITLNPPQLGPIEISLNVKNDQATALFMSANADVRAAIESAMPRLREMLDGVGVQLGQTNVSAESFRQSADSNAQERNRAGSERGSSGEPAGQGSVEAMAGTAIKRGNGLVDTFA
ncbi:MAG: flagellar hook-length control protein FliK [Sterolibacterium sp.]